MASMFKEDSGIFKIPPTPANVKEWFVRVRREQQTIKKRLLRIEITLYVSVALGLLGRAKEILGLFGSSH